VAGVATLENSGAAESAAAWQLLVGVHEVLSLLAVGEVHTAVTDDTVHLGDLDHAEMTLIEAAPQLITRHAGLLDDVRAGLRATRAQRCPYAWTILTRCYDMLASLTGGRHLGPLPNFGKVDTAARRMRAVVAPHPFSRSIGDGPAVFLAGGITGCPDWQQAVTMALRGEHVVVLNPRQPHYDADNPDNYTRQVDWEFTHRNHEALAYMLFWFPAPQIQPIALFELGDALARPELPVVVGADPRYSRHLDVVQQCRAARPQVIVHDDLDSTVAELQTLLRWRPPTVSSN